MPAIDHPLIDRFLDALWLEKGLSDNTRQAYRSDLALFNGWLQEKNLELINAGRELILDHLAWRLEQNYKPRSTARFLSGVRGFYRYLLREKLIALDPTLQVDMPQLGRPLPKSLSEADVDALLAAPDLSEAIGQRDRAMLEVLYACGLRVTELISLTLEQVNLRQGVLRVMGKGSKERLVPMGEEAIVWIERYMRDARSELLGGRPSDEQLTSLRGEQMTRRPSGTASSTRPRWLGSARACRPILCVTRLPPICSTTARICAWCKCSLATATYPQPRSTPMWHGRACRICMPSTIRVAENRQIIPPRAALRPNCGRLCRLAKGTA